MKTISLSEVEAFLAVASCHSFGKAARELGIAQSTVSRRITNLESRLAQQLVLRTTRRVALTDAGLSYASDLRDVVARLESADARLQSGSIDAEGVLRVTMPTSFGRTFVLPRIARLAARYPRLRFEVDLSDRYADLMDGEYDVAIRLASPSQSGVRYEKIHTFSLALCAAPSYLEENGLLNDISDIPAHFCLAQRVYAPVISFPVSWQGRKTNLQINPRISVSDSTSLRTLTLAGSGLAVLPLYLVKQELEEGRLIEALPGLEFAEYDVFAAYLRHRGDSAKVKVFLEELRIS
ncbi:LysR family transcriptional regulator [Pseudomonas sp. NPDC089918]|uniref:LysR family transcriptional regulator n=1 Tax=Pseudomonas sp. NPDC089918 TaxID=3390654 RepID=UPI003D0161B6